MDILYHYCSTASFHAIVQSRSLRLSSLSLSNDTMEGKLVSRTIVRLARKDSLDQNFVHRLQGIVENLEGMVDGLGFCLSEDGDLLSQWRGYAADASGVAIGFSTSYLNWLSEESTEHPIESNIILQKVKYEEADHESYVEPTYRKVKLLIDEGAFKMPSVRGLLETRTKDEIEQENVAISKTYSKLTSESMNLLLELFLLKANAFREEREWRLLAYLVTGAEHCSHRALHDRIVPYRKVELKELERQPIVEVILGPKHSTPIKVVEDFLKQGHFGAVKVRSSKASYR